MTKPKKGKLYGRNKISANSSTKQRRKNQTYQSENGKHVTKYQM